MIGPAIRDKPFSSVLRRGIERGELPSPASLVWTVLAGLVAIFETP